MVVGRPMKREFWGVNVISKSEQGVMTRGEVVVGWFGDVETV